MQMFCIWRDLGTLEDIWMFFGTLMWKLFIFKGLDDDFGYDDNDDFHH